MPVILGIEWRIRRSNPYRIGLRIRARVPVPGHVNLDPAADCADSYSASFSLAYLALISSARLGGTTS